MYGSRIDESPSDQFLMVETPTLVYEHSKHNLCYDEDACNSSKCDSNDNEVQYECLPGVGFRFAGVSTFCASSRLKTHNDKY